MKVSSLGLLCIVLGAVSAATNNERLKRNTYNGSGNSNSYTNGPNYRTGSYGSGTYRGGSFSTNSITSYPAQGAQRKYSAYPYPYVVLPMYQQSWHEDEIEEEPGIDLLAIKSAVAKAVLGTIAKVKGSILATAGKVIKTKGDIVAAKGGALLKLGEAFKSLGG